VSSRSRSRSRIPSSALSRLWGYTFASMRTLASEGARFQYSSDQSLLVYFDEHVEQKKTGGAPDRVGTGAAPPLQSRVTLRAHENVRRLLRLLELEPVPGVRNLHPAYCSLLVKFDAIRMRHEEVEGILRKYLERLEEVKLPEPRRVEIPVCYHGEFGPDLDEVSALRGITQARAIELHTSVEYLVYFLGFVPGFAYLGELPEELVTPRMATPRKQVPAGSVGIAGSQTGVYPFATPGGWRLLGRTPLKMFRADSDALSLLSIGDRVRFTPISRERFAALESA
jgi:KipI family sensor histidine kinase inhibitor